MEETRQDFGRQTCVGRIGEVDETAELMAFLVSNDCSFTHGAEIIIDGGMILK